MQQNFDQVRLVD